MSYTHSKPVIPIDLLPRESYAAWDDADVFSQISPYIESLEDLVDSVDDVGMLTRAQTLAHVADVLSSPSLEADMLVLHGVRTRTALASADADAPKAYPYEFAECKRAIREAIDGLEPSQAVEVISRIWEHLDECAALAEARMRILLKRVMVPDLSEEPDWLSDVRRILLGHKNTGDGSDSDLASEPPIETPVRAAVESALLLVRACIANPSLRHMQPEFESGPLGRVLVDWQFQNGHRVQWMIAPPELPWPGVALVSMYRRGHGRSAARVVRTIHTAFQAIEQVIEARGKAT